MIALGRLRFLFKKIFKTVSKLVSKCGNMMMPEISFNIDHGYLEGLLRGFKSGILKQADYLNLIQCETLDGKFIRYTIVFNPQEQVLI